MLFLNLESLLDKRRGEEVVDLGLDEEHTLRSRRLPTKDDRLVPPELTLSFPSRSFPPLRIQFASSSAVALVGGKKKNKIVQKYFKKISPSTRYFVLPFYITKIK